MAATKETQKVKDFTETVKGMTGLVKENYINGVEFALSLWDGNPKAINGQVDRLVAFQKDYVDSVRKVSDKFTKEALNLTQKNVEKAFSLIDDYIGLFRV